MAVDDQLGCANVDVGASGVLKELELSSITFNELLADEGIYESHEEVLPSAIWTLVNSETSLF
jgi:hypothetical protein